MKSWMQPTTIPITVVLIILMGHSDGDILASDQIASLNAVQFVGTEFGVAVGDRNTIKLTNDKGQTWRVLSTGHATQWNDLHFLTDHVGWIVGGAFPITGAASSGILIHTTDAGQSWQAIENPDWGMLFAVRFFDLQHGIVAGHTRKTGASGIWKTADGGQSWQAVTGPENAGWRCASFPSWDSGVVGGRRGAVGLIGGNRWLPDVGLNLGLRGIREITVDKQGRGWLVGDGGLIRFAPAGSAWQDAPAPLPIPESHSVDHHTVATMGNQVWLAGSPGTVIWKSLDNGQHWKAVSTGVTTPLNHIHFSNQTTGWAVGELGVMLVTHDGGESWQRINEQSPRLALVQIVPRKEDLSFHLAAKYSADQGYHTGAIVFSRQDQSASQSYRSIQEDLLADQAWGMVGGHAIELSWSFPLDIPDLSANQNALLGRWQETSDGQFAQLSLHQLVRQLRTYRPSIVIVNAPDSTDAVSQVLEQLVRQAINHAADQQWSPEYSKGLQLLPWQVSRMFWKSQDRAGGDYLLDASDYLPQVGQSIRMASAGSYQIVHEDQQIGPLMESYRWAGDPQHQPPVSHDLFAGIVLGPGSGARQLFPASENKDKQSQGEKLARHQRNMSAYLNQIDKQGIEQANLLAQMGDVLADAPDDQAVIQLLEMAERFRRDSQWDYYEAVLMQLIEKYPAQPQSFIAARELIQLWTSEEMILWRLQSRRVSKTEQRSRSSSDIEQVGFQQEALPLSLNANALQDRAAWRETWAQRAIALVKTLDQRAPQLLNDPELQFPLVSFWRRRGSHREADLILQQFLQVDSQKFQGTQRIAHNEFWTRSQIGVPPQQFEVAKYAEQPPYLDGMLSDPCWQQATENRLHSHRFGVKTGDLIFWANDSEYLYLAGSFAHHQPPQDENNPFLREQDANLTGTDRIQWKLDIDRDYHTSYQMEVNWKGQVREACHHDPHWNAKWHVATKSDPERWRVEVAIPLRELVGDRKLGLDEIWAVSCQRTLPAVDTHSWTGQQSEPDAMTQFGLLRLEH